MPNFDTSVALVETATKCFATDDASPPSAAERPIARGVGVGHGLERGEGLGRNDEQSLGRIETAHGFGEIGAIHVGDEAEGHRAVAVGSQRFIGHHRAEIRTADADIDHVANRACRCGLSMRRCGCDSRRPPSYRARRGLPARRSCHRQRSTRTAGARNATCSTARFSVTLIFSPRNMASMRSRKSRFGGELQEQMRAFRR